MPVLEISSQVAPKDLKAFIKRLSVIFAEQIGKPEAYCLVTFTKVDEFIFAGSTDNGYIIRVGSIGNIAEERNINLTKAITDELKKELGIDNNRGYVLFQDYPAANIGFTGTVFSTILK
ncbi:Tautomerase/MIF superfamily [Chlamydoabsidia padenii]|nr:Tautomerase/MIF superfamily [Chlamydoabsidia padenii]